MARGARGGGLVRRALAVSAGVALVAGLVLAVIVLSLLAGRRSNDRVRHSQQVLRVALDGQKAVIDLETGLRGFVITPAGRFLAPWRSGLRTAPERVARLQALVADNPAQERRARAIARDLRAYIGRYGRPLVATVRRDPARARTPAVTSEGKRRVDALRARFDAVIAAERSLLTARTLRADRTATRAIIVASAGLAALLGLIVLLGWFVARRIAAPLQRLAGAAHRIAAGELQTRVPEGGGAEIGTLSAAFNAMAVSLAAAQAELQARNAELERVGARNLALLDTVFVQAPMGLAIFDADLRFVRLNEALAEIDGVAVDAHIGRTPAQVLPRLGEPIAAGLRRALRDGAAQDIEVAGASPSAPDEPRVWRVSCFAVRAGQETTGAGAVVVDITEHRRAARERERLLRAERIAAERTARLQGVTAELSRAVRTSDVAQVIVEQGLQALGALGGALLLVREGSGVLEVAATAGVVETPAHWRWRPWGPAHPAADAMRAGEVLVLSDRDGLLARYPHLHDRLDAGQRAWVAAPVRTAERSLGAVVYAFGRERALDDEERRLLALVLAQGAEALQRAALYERQQHIASTLQGSLVPAGLPDVPGVELAALYRAAGDGYHVGGDFYDVLRAHDGRWLVAIGDVEGKGPEAAALTGLLRHTLRTEAMHESRPARLVERLNRAVHRADTERFCTVALVAIDPDGDHMRLSVACGGHLPPIVTGPRRGAAVLSCRGTLLGLLPEVDVPEHALALGGGEGLVLYTDGVLDARAPGTTLTPEALADALAAHAALPPGELVRRVQDLALPDGAAPRDDIAVLCLRVARAAGDAVVESPNEGWTGVGRSSDEMGAVHGHPPGDGGEEPRRRRWPAVTLNIGIGLALVCAALTQLSFLCKHRGANSVAAVDLRRPLRSARALLGARWFAIGMGVAVAAWLLHVAALASAPLSVVQAVLSTGVVMLAVLGSRLFGCVVSRRQWTGVAMTAGGLVLLVVTLPGQGAHSAYAFPALLAFEGGMLGLGALLIAAPRLGAPAHHHGAVLGAASGILFGVSDVALKALTGAAAGGLLGLAASPWLPIAVLASALAFLASARGFQQGDAVPVIACTSTAANVTCIVGGIAVFGDALAANAIVFALQLGAFALVAVAALVTPAGHGRVATA